MMAVRLSLVAISVLAIAWLAVLLRDQEVGQAAYARIRHSGAHAPAELARDLGRLKEAQFLNPDSRWKLYRGSFLLYRNPREGNRVLEALARSEPDNIEAWSGLLLGTRGAERRRAVTEIKRLDPLARP